MASGTAWVLGDVVAVDAERKYGQRDSDTGQAWLRELSEDRTEARVEWLVAGCGGDGSRSEWVRLARVHAVALTSPPRKRGATAAGLPNPTSGASTTTATVGKRAKSTNNTPPLVASLSWRPGVDGPHPLAAIYKRGRDKPAGWRREQLRRELGLDGEAPKQMAPQEQVVYALEFTALSGLALPPAGPGLPMTTVNNAWGVSERYHVKAVTRIYSNSDGERKQRSDTGRSVFTDFEFASRRITGLSEYRRSLTASGDTGASQVNADDSKAEFDALPANEQQAFEYLAEQRRARIPHAQQEAIEVLRRTGGLISWTTLAAEIGDYCDASTLARHFQSIPDFEYVSVGTVPLLTKQCIAQRLLWARSFWNFSPSPSPSHVRLPTGPHQCKHLQAFMQEEFAKRGWHCKYQPPQSPLANTKDAQIFPALSKRVSRGQSLDIGSRPLLQEEIWTHAKAAWDDLTPSDIARSFMSHHQIVNAIIKHKGTNDFIRERGGLHFGIRQTYQATDDGMQLLEREEVEVDDNAPALKFQPPEYDPSLEQRWLDGLNDAEKHSVTRWKRTVAADAAAARAEAVGDGPAARAVGRRDRARHEEPDFAY